MGIGLRSGRDFSDQDAPGASRPPIIVNETLARLLYPNTDAVGRPVLIGRETTTIVGVVADVRQGSLDEAPVSQLYVSPARSGDELIMRTTLPADSLTPSLRAWRHGAGSAAASPGRHTPSVFPRRCAGHRGGVAHDARRREFVVRDVADRSRHIRRDGSHPHSGRTRGRLHSRAAGITPRCDAGTEG